MIGCKCEAGIERELDPDETPDGRPGVSVLLFAMDSEGVGKRLVERVGQSVLTCPTTACFNGLDAEDTVDVGGQLRFFGDGYQASKVLDGQRYWRVPVMEGEFLVQERFGTVEGVAGGNIIMLGRDAESALRAAEAAAAAMRSVEGVIMPFPGGIVRSGSKVGSRYKALPASTNDVLCPTLRGQVEHTDVPPDVEAVFEIVIDGLGLEPVREAMRRRARGRRRGGRQPRHGRQLRRQPRAVPHPPARAAAVTLTLTLREQPDVPLEAEVLTPDRLAGADDIAALPVWHGNERTRVGEFFEVSGAGDDVRLEGDLSRVKFVGAGMTAGRLTVAGDVGMHAGAGMRGGELHVEGDAGDWAGAGMHGGRLVVHGSAGRQLGGVYAGERAGMRGGEIVVHGDAGAQAGAGLRRGLIAVAGRAGEAAGLRMLAGTIVALGGVGRAGGSRHAARLDRHDGAGDAARDLRLRLHLPPAVPAPVPAPAARARAARLRRAARRSLRALVRRQPRAAARRDPDLGGRMTSSTTARSTLADRLAADAEALQVDVTTLSNGTRVIDCGAGGFEAGRYFAEICMGGLGTVAYAPLVIEGRWLPALTVTTDRPAVACLAAQYAGWKRRPRRLLRDGQRARPRADPRRGPLRRPRLGRAGERRGPVPGDARAAAGRGRRLRGRARRRAAVGADAADGADGERAPAACRSRRGSSRPRCTSSTSSTSTCGGSLAGYGSCPLPPVAGDDMAALGRTNDAVLYGGQVHLTVEADDDDELRELVERLPASASSDYGEPFGKVLKDAEFDFYKIDPLLFSPAQIRLTSVESGRSFEAGRVNLEVLERSFWG